MNAGEVLVSTLTAFAESIKQFRQGQGKIGKYSSLEDYALKNGKLYHSQPLTSDELNIVLNAVGRRKFMIKQCFYNSMSLASMFKDLIYTEGYCFSIKVPLPIFHAWVTINNKVVDVTLRCHNKKGKLGYATLGEFDEESNAYFGIAFSQGDVLKFMLETECYGSMINDWTRGFPLLK